MTHLRDPDGDPSVLTVIVLAVVLGSGVGVLIGWLSAVFQ